MIAYIESIRRDELGQMPKRILKLGAYDWNLDSEVVVKSLRGEISALITIKEYLEFAREHKCSIATAIEQILENTTLPHGDGLYRSSYAHAKNYYTAMLYDLPQSQGE